MLHASPASDPAVPVGVGFPADRGHRPDDARLDARDIVNLSRLGSENLVSLAIIATRSAGTDIAELRAVSRFAQEYFQYYEILVVAAVPSADWTAELRQAGTEEPNTRIISVDTRMNFEELVAVVLRQAIGDYIVSVLPGEVGSDDLLRIVTLLAGGQRDLVKVVFPVAGVPLFERSFARLAQWSIRLATGYRIQSFQARAFALSRNAVSRLQTNGTTLKFFRILDMSGSIAQATITVDRPRRRNLFMDMIEKFRLATELVSRSSARLIRTLAVICMILSVTSLAATVFSFLVWVFKSDVAPGWTSLTMISSFLFAANFGVLSSICLGMLLLIRRGEPDTCDSSVTELSGGDLFLHDERLNVKTGAADA